MGKHNPEVCLIDLGCARNPLECPDEWAFVDYAQGPEIIMGICYDFCSDIFALGVLLFEMWAGKHLFNDPSPTNRLAIMHRVLGPAPHEMIKKCSTVWFREDNSPDIDPETQAYIDKDFAPLEEYIGMNGLPDPVFIDLIRKMWSYNYRERQLAPSFMEHEFFGGMADIYDCDEYYN